MTSLRVRSHSLTSLLRIVVLASVVGCPACEQTPETAAGQKNDTATDKAGAKPPEPTNLAPGKLPKDAVLLAVKDGKPFLLVNVASRLDSLKRVDRGDQEAFLQGQALWTVVDAALGHQPYQGKDHFVVRMITITERDEYARPKWGSAVELAVLELDRAAVAGLTTAGVEKMPPEKTTSLFTARRFSLENLAGGK